MNEFRRLHPLAPLAHPEWVARLNELRRALRYRPRRGFLTEKRHVKAR